MFALRHLVPGDLCNGLLVEASGGGPKFSLAIPTALASSLTLRRGARKPSVQDQVSAIPKADINTWRGDIGHISFGLQLATLVGAGRVAREIEGAGGQPASRSILAKRVGPCGVGYILGCQA